MDIREIGVVGLSSSRIDYFAQQQKVVARNVSNADVPGYRALEMRPFSDVLKGVSASQPSMTHAKHLPGTAGGGAASAVPSRSAPSSPSGNNVVLDEQIVSAAEAQAGHSLATAIYKKATFLLQSSVR